MQKPKIKISVIVPALNEEKHIKDCLDSINRQHVGYPFETIVVNGPSKDATAMFAADKGVTVLNLKEKGINIAWQMGVKMAKSEILAFTEADTVVPENWLERILGEFEKDSRVVGVVGQYRLKKSVFFNYVIAIFMPFFDDIFKWWTGFTTLRGTNFAVRKDALIACGGFNTMMKTYGDIELSLRLGKFGKVIYRKDLIVKTENRNFVSLYSQVRMYTRALKALFYVAVLKKPHKFNSTHERE